MLLIITLCVILSLCTLAVGKYSPPITPRTKSSRVAVPQPKKLSGLPNYTNNEHSTLLRGSVPAKTDSNTKPSVVKVFEDDDDDDDDGKFTSARAYVLLDLSKYVHMH